MSIPPPLISRYTSVISEATGFNYIAIHRHIVGFNPCFLEGRDYRCKTAKLISKPFQSTLPRRERRRQLPGNADNVASFNPRSHEGSDARRSTAPAGATCFNPRSHEGSDVSAARHGDGAHCFNPRSHEGSDTGIQRFRSIRICFNPRSHEGSDLSISSST